MPKYNIACDNIEAISVEAPDPESALPLFLEEAAKIAKYHDLYEPTFFINGKKIPISIRKGPITVDKGKPFKWLKNYTLYLTDRAKSAIAQEEYLLIFHAIAKEETEIMTPKWRKQALFVVLQEYMELLPWAVSQDKTHIFIAKYIGENRDCFYLSDGETLFSGDSHQTTPPAQVMELSVGSEISANNIITILAKRGKCDESNEVRGVPPNVFPVKYNNDVGGKENQKIPVIKIIEAADVNEALAKIKYIAQISEATVVKNLQVYSASNWQPIKIVVKGEEREPNIGILQIEFDTDKNIVFRL